jgi:hypothetical protein
MHPAAGLAACSGYRQPSCAACSIRTACQQDLLFSSSRMPTISSSKLRPPTATATTQHIQPQLVTAPRSMFGWATAPPAANVGTGATAAAAAQRLTVMFASSTVMDPVPAAVPAATVASYTSALTASFASSAACLATCCLSAPAHIAPGTSLRPTTCTPVCSAQPPVANPWPAHHHRISEQRLASVVHQHSTAHHQHCS